MTLAIPNGSFIPKAPKIEDPEYTIWDRWVFENFLLADEPFLKVLWILEACESFNNN